MKLLKLHKQSSPKEDWMLFVGTEHLNASNRTGSNEFLFQLNIRAGEKAISIAAYDSAAKCFEKATIHILSRSDPWESNYDVVLSTYRKYADVLLRQGDYEQGECVAQTLLKNAKSIDDKLDTLVSLCVALGKQYKQQESMDLSLKTLQKLREYPKTKAGVIAGIGSDMLAVNRYFKTHTDEDILKLPLITSERKKRVIQLMLSTTYQVRDPCLTFCFSMSTY